MTAWVEIRADFDAQDTQLVSRLIDAAVSCGAKVHAFFYEPWSPIVVRARGDESTIAALRALFAGWEYEPEVAPWAPIDDEDYFGPEVYHKAIVPFFEASTRVAYETTMLKSSDSRLSRGLLFTKLVHCFLNAQGLDTPDEAGFARSFMRNREQQARRDYGRFWRFKQK